MLCNPQARALIVVAAFGCSAPSVATASPVVAPTPFSTSGTIGEAGVSGTNVISFEGVDNGRLYDSFPGLPAGPAWLDAPILGNFRITAPPAGTVTRYTDTPLSIQFAAGGAAPVTLSGVLNGTVDGSGKPDLTMTLDAPGSFTIPNIFASESPNTGRGVLVPTGAVTSVLTLPLGPMPLYPSTTAGVIPLNTYIYPVPEPASLAVFACLAGLLIRRHGLASNRGDIRNSSDLQSRTRRPRG